MLSKIRTVSTLLAASLVAVTCLGQSDKVVVHLKEDPTLLVSDAGQKLGLAYLPNVVELSPEAPAGIKREPVRVGQSRYGQLRLGDGAQTLHVFRIDTDLNSPSKLYVDLAGDGILSEAKWTQSAGVYSGTIAFSATYKAGHGVPYGLTFTWDPSKNWLSYHRAGGRVGKATIDGTTYDLKVIENDNDGLFNKSFASKPQQRPVWILVDGVVADARGTFGIGDTNYKALFSADGATLTLTPTATAITYPEQKDRKKPGPGDLAPDFIALTEGADLRLSDLRGQVVVVDLWATWCGPCKASLPHVQEVSERYKSKGVKVLGLNVYDDKPAFDAWVSDNKQFSFLFAYDGGGRDRGSSIAASKFGVDAIPTSFVIDRSGKITAEVVGFMGPDDHRLEDAINKALEDPAK